jgi:hypothetical protein
MLPDIGFLRHQRHITRACLPQGTNSRCTPSARMLPSVIGGSCGCFCLAMADHRRLPGESGWGSPWHIVVRTVSSCRRTSAGFGLAGRS